MRNTDDSGTQATHGATIVHGLAGWLRRFDVRVALFYAALFLIYGVQVPYLPIWLDWRGLSAAEIGFASAAPFFIRCFTTPALALYADRTGNHRGIILVCACAGLAAALALSAVGSVMPVIVLATLMAVSASSIVPLVETVAMDGVARGGHDYGRMRLWGSLTFILASFAGGAIIDRMGAGIGIWLLVAGAVATVAAALHLPRADHAHPAGTTTLAPMRLADAARLVRTPLFLVFLVAVGATQASHALFYTFGALHWKSQGISSAGVGVLWAIGVLAEVALFHYSGAIIGRFGLMQVLLAGALGCVVRWSALALDPPFALLVPLQVLHALSYAATHIGAMHFIGRAVPQVAAGTAQGLYATVAAGIGHGLATLASSALYPQFGGGAYLAMAAMSALGLAAALHVFRRWDGGPLWHAATGEQPAAKAAT